MARIPLVDEGPMTPEQRAVYDAVVSGPRGKLVGPLRAALHRPDLADVWQRFGAIVRFGTCLPPRYTELAILVTARRWNSQLEWHVHARAALDAGIPSDVIEDLKNGRSPVFADEDAAAVYEFARELQMYGEIADDTYHRVVSRWDSVGVVELTALIGYYTLVSMTLNAHHIPLPDGAEPPLREAALPKVGGLTEIPASKPSADADDEPQAVPPGRRHTASP